LDRDVDVAIQRSDGPSSVAASVVRVQLLVSAALPHLQPAVLGPCQQRIPVPRSAPPPDAMEGGGVAKIELKLVYAWGDSDVILSTVVDAAMSEVYCVAAV